MNTTPAASSTPVERREEDSMGGIAMRNSSTHRIRQHLLQDPDRLAPGTAFTDAHPTLCGRWRFADALPEGDYSGHRMCGVCARIAASNGAA